MNNELIRMWKEAVITYFKILFRYSHRGTEEKWIVGDPAETRTRYQVRSVTAWVIMFVHSNWTTKIRCLKSTMLLQIQNKCGTKQDQCSTYRLFPFPVKPKKWNRLYLSGYVIPGNGMKSTSRGVHFVRNCQWDPTICTRVPLTLLQWKFKCDWLPVTVAHEYD
jgi:hypothetical protein